MINITYTRICDVCKCDIREEKYTIRDEASHPVASRGFHWKWVAHDLCIQCAAPMVEAFNEVCRERAK